jgi:hypothetical protein
MHVFDYTCLCTFYIVCWSIPWLHVPLHISRCKHNKPNKQTSIVLWLVKTKMKALQNYLLHLPRTPTWYALGQNQKFWIEVGDKIAMISGWVSGPKIEFLRAGIPTCGRDKWKEGQFCTLHSTGVYWNNWPDATVRTVWRMLIGCYSSKHRSFVCCCALLFLVVWIWLLELWDGRICHKQQEYRRIWLVFFYCIFSDFFWYQKQYLLLKLWLWRDVLEQITIICHWLYLLTCIVALCHMVTPS